MNEAQKLMCIRILGSNPKQLANIVDTFIVVVNDALLNIPVKKTDVIRAVIVKIRTGVKG